MISIFMPLYNGIEFIEESIGSVLNQTFTDWELIIGVNGYEKDSDVFKKVERYHKDIRIKVYDFFDCVGKSETLNRMLKYANNDIICILDVDDKWLPNKLESQFKYAYKYDIIGTHCSYFGELNNSPHLILGEVKKENFLQFNSIINSSAMIVRRGRDIFWRSEWDGVEDYDLWIRLSFENWYFFNLTDKLTLHRIHKNSFYNTKNSDLANKLLEVMRA